MIDKSRVASLSSQLLLLLIIIPIASFASLPELILDNHIAEQSEPMRIMDYSELLEDSSGELTLSDILHKSDDFKEANPANGDLDLFVTQSAYWFRVVINNQSDKVNWYFTMSGSLSRRVDLYLKPTSSNESFVQKTTLPYSRSIQYQLTLQPKQRYFLYYRVQDKQAPLIISPRLRSSTQMLLNVMVTYPLFSFVIGGLLTLAAYNFLYFLYLRDHSFLALSVFIFSFVLELGNHSGFWYYFNFFRQYLVEMGSTFGLIGLAAVTSMASSFLEMREYLPRMYSLLRAIFWVCLSSIPFQWWFGYGTIFVGALGLLLIVPLIVAPVLRHHQGYRSPLMLRIGVGLVLFAFVPALLRAAGLIGDFGSLTDGMYFTLLIALLMLSLTQAEQVREKSEAADRTTAANEAKDQFLTTMNHELRTPMNAVVSAGRLLEQTSLNGEQKEYVSRLNTSSNHMLELVNDILDLARLDSSLLIIETIPLRLEEILQQINQLLSESARSKSLKLTLDNRFHLDKQLLGDPTRLQQILLNLLGNAIKFTPHGEVSLTITLQTVTPDIARILFEVRDTGIGMTIEQQKKLFQPFSQVDSSTARKYGGSGLGLSISQKLVDQMKGELQVDSKLGVGSCFSFSLPFNLQEPEPLLLQKRPEYCSLSAGFRVLLVDDDEMNRFFGKKILARLYVEVELAESGEQALQLLESQQFDLVFMDVSMPGMDGYETTRRIREDGRYQQLLIVALTAHAIAGERERCIAAGMNDYLSKPFEIEDIQQTLSVIRN